MANINDIAIRAGVAISTVSRVLNYDSSLSLSEEKRKLIFEIAEELEYKTPRSRKDKKVKPVIGILHFLTMAEEVNDPYYISIRFGIEKRALEEEFEIEKIFMSTDRKLVLPDKKIDALIVIGKFAKKEISMLSKKFDKIVFVDFSPSEHEFDSVVFDVKEVVSSIIEYFLENGIEQIGFLGGNENFEDYKYDANELRLKHFIDIMSEKGLYNPNWVFKHGFRPEDGYNMIKEAIKGGDMPMAFMTANDSIAVGALNALNKNKIKVPDEISIIGINDIPTSKFTTPPLTTVKIYSELMGEEAVLKVVQLLNGRTIPIKSVIPTSIVSRKSVKKIKNTK